MGGQDRWPDGEKKHKVWHIEGRGICIIANKPCPKDKGMSYCYETCKDCPNFKLKITEEITDWDATM